MAVADSVFESLQCFQSMMESFDESLSQLREDNSFESVLNVWKNLLEYYRELHKALQSRCETPKIKEHKSEEPGTRGENEENKTSEVTGSSPTSSSVSKVFSSVEVRPELKILCDKGDGYGLRNYIADNIKEVETLRNELREGLSKSPDAAKLVMKALEDYPLRGYRGVRIKNRRRASILLLESLFPVFGNDGSGVVPADIKDSAREIAKVWRKEMKFIRKEALNIRAFLQLLTSCRIAADYKKDELLALVSVILPFKGTPELCRSLGLSYEALKINEEKPEEPRTRGENEENRTSEVTASVPNSSSVSKVVLSVEIHDEIKILCDKADGHGLINFIVDNVKKFQTFQNELPVAVSKAPDAGKLVMKALEGYPLSENNSDLRALNRKRACILLLESYFPVFGNDESGVVPSDVKDSAREIAKAWRKNMKVSKKHGWNTHAFLQLLASFRIAADYKKDELLALLSVILMRYETPELCRSLGLSSEAPNLIRKIPPTSGSPHRTLRFAHVCGVMDKVDPVGLLTSYLRNVDKYAEKLLTNGQGSVDSQLQSNTKKLFALKNAIKLVQEYGLQSHFLGDNWEKKLRELEQERDELQQTIMKISQEKSAADKEAREKEDGKEAAEKKALEKEDGMKAIEKEAHEKEDGKKAAEQKEHEKEDGKKAAEQKEHKKDGKKAAEQKEHEKDGKKAAEKKAQEKEDGKEAAEKKVHEKEDGKKAAEKKVQEKEDGKKAAEKKAHEKEDGQKVAEKKAQEKEDAKKNTEKKIDELRKAIKKNSKEKLADMEEAQNKEDEKKAAEKEAKEKEDGKKVAEEAQEKERKKVPEEKAQEKEDGKKAAEKKAQQKEDGKKASEKKAQEKEDGRKAAEKNVNHTRCQSFELGYGPPERENYASKRAKYASLINTTSLAGGTGNSKSSPYNIDGFQNKSGIIGHDNHTSAFSAVNSSTGFAAGAFSSAPSTAAQEKEDGNKAFDKNGQHKRRQSFEPGCGPSERENYASKRANYASLSMTTRVGVGMGNSKASLYNVYVVQDKSGITGHDHHTSAFSAARSSTGFAPGAFSSAPSTAAQINDERRHNSSAFGTSNVTPIGSSLYGSSAPAGSFAIPMSNVGEIDYVGRGEQSYPMNFGKDKNHVRASVYGTGDMAKSSATQSNYNYEGRGQQSYKLNFGEVDNNPASASAYGIGILENSSATQSHYERRGRELFTSALGGSNMSSIGAGDLAKSSATQSSYNYEGRGQQSYKLNFGEVDNNPVSASTYGIGVLENSSATQSHCERRGRELYTSAFGGGNTSSIGSSVYGSNSRTIPSSGVNQGGHERSLGQYSGFAGRNMVSIGSTGYGPGVSTTPPSNVTEGHFESRGPVMDRYKFNSGLTSRPPA